MPEVWPLAAVNNDKEIFEYTPLQVKQELPAMEERTKCSAANGEDIIKSYRNT